jgi:hypothetical protein
MLAAWAVQFQAEPLQPDGALSTQVFYTPSYLDDGGSDLIEARGGNRSVLVFRLAGGDRSECNRFGGE